MSKPVETITVPTGKGTNVRAAVWENEHERDKEKYTFYSVTIEKGYRDADGWKSSKSFHASDLLALAYVANQAYERTLELRQKPDF